VQGVARHWRNPVRTKVTPLDSSDALYIVVFAYTVKPMDNVVRFRHPCVGPVPIHAVTSVYIPCFGLYHFIQTIPKVCIIKTILYNPMITIKRVNDPTISVHFFISQPVYDSVTYRINYKHNGN
jgi:hypothetical protein